MEATAAAAAGAEAEAEAEAGAPPQDTSVIHGDGTSSSDSDESAGTSDDTPLQPTTLDSATVFNIIRILGLRPITKEYFKTHYKAPKEFEEFLQLTSEEVRTMMEEEGRDLRFSQADRSKLILLRRWMKNNLDDDQKVKWNDFTRENFDEFVCEKVDVIILGEIWKELNLNDYEQKKLKNNGVHTPDSFVEKSKYWYQHDILSHDDDSKLRKICEFEKFKRWYKYQLDTYLPWDWIASFRKESKEEREIEWRKVMNAIGLSADAIQVLEINDVGDFSALNRKSTKWRINEPRKKSDPDSAWQEWKKLGLKENDALNIIHFRHWHNFYVAGKKETSDWAAEFRSKQYSTFVHRYIDPSKPDKFKTRFLRKSKDDGLKTLKEKKDYLVMLEGAAEEGVVTEEQRYRLRQHYEGRREKMELIQEINEGSGDHSFEERRLNEIMKDEAESEHHKEELYLKFFQKYCQFFFSAIVVYVLLLCWIGTIVFFMVEETSTNTYAIFIHNITFGLVTAVVLQELGEEMKDTSLYNRFLPIYEERLERAKVTRFEIWLKLRSISCCSCRNASYKVSGLCKMFWEMCKHLFTGLILMSTRIFILSWVIWGAICLIYGVIKDLDSTASPLYTTGQTWAGIAVTIGYSYFGLSDKSGDNGDQSGDKSGGDSADEIGGEGATDTDSGRKVAGKDEDAATHVTDKESIESQLEEAQDKLNEAVDKGDNDAIVQCSKQVVKLRKKLKEE